MITREVTREQVMNGWAMLGILVAATLGLIGWVVYGAVNEDFGIWSIVLATIATLVLVFLYIGFFTLQPNEAAVLVLFGAYKGTVKSPGFKWANPLLLKIKISQRFRNLNGEKTKVNDARGNPIEIAAVVVWHVADTAKAAFDVDDYEHYVTVQSESALRHLAMSFPYDCFGEDKLSLRGSTDEVSERLKIEVQDRVGKAGVIIEEARISHLAYAPEIAAAMLQRQQAQAVVAARTKIVEGAVGMVEMALDHLAKDEIVVLDEERRAAMVSNLLVVLCSDRHTQPVVNTGSLYT